MRRTRYVVQGFGPRSEAVVGLPNNWASDVVERYVRLAYLVKDKAFGSEWSGRGSRLLLEYGEAALQAAGYLPASVQSER